MTITASKPFLSPEELPGLLDELIGEGVVFSNVALEQAHDFSMLGLRPAETSYDFVADVDPAPDLEILGDAVIEGLLGSSLGRSLTRVEEDAGGSFAGSLGLVVNVQLPANIATDSELGETVDNVVTWEFSYGDAPTTIDARASIDEILPRVWSLVAILAALLFVLVVLSRLATFVIVKLRTPRVAGVAISVSARSGLPPEQRRPTVRAAACCVCSSSTSTAYSCARPTRSTVC